MAFRQKEEMIEFLSTITFNEMDPYSALIHYHLKGAKEQLFYMNQISLISFEQLSSSYQRDIFHHLKSFSLPSNKENYIKMYLPLDGEHVVEGVSQLFRWMEEEEIVHESKISPILGTDDVVVRTDGLSSALSIQQFVQQNDCFQEGLLEPHPFIFQEDRVALARDGFVSYNDELSYYLGKYREAVLAGEEDLGVDSFQNFISSFYHSVFLDGDKFKCYLQERRLQPFIPATEQLVERLEIGRLIVGHITEGGNFTEYYSSFVDPEVRLKEQKIIHSLLENHSGIPKKPVKVFQLNYNYPISKNI